MNSWEADPSRAERGLRALLLGVIVIGILGTGAELLLLEHYETAWQYTPLICLGAGLASAVAVVLLRSRGSVRIFQTIMSVFVIAGTMGLYLHYKGNSEFELEMYPTMAGLELFKESMMGATPALAPGAMAWLGLLGLAFAFRHPWTRVGSTHRGGRR